MVQAEQQEQIQHLIQQAKSVLAGKETKEANECLSLAIQLQHNNENALARLLLDTVAQTPIEDPELKQRVARARAQATINDSHLGRDEALTRALNIVKESFDLATTADQETLGLVGAVYKRKWEVDTNKLNLEQALRFYRRGYEAGVENDNGNTAVNAAFVQDLLAHIEENQARVAGTDSITAPGRRQDAREIREDIIKLLTPAFEKRDSTKLTEKDYNGIAVLAEACFGLQRYEEAGQWLSRLKTVEEMPQWNYLRIAKQLSYLTQIQSDKLLSDAELESTEAWQTLCEFLGQKTAAVRTLFLGKMGLALSGGGFRASLYHLGVFAKLAELDLLRHVEVLSCVSGGSIVGAYYYLALRRLFNKEKLTDEQFTRDQYIELVEDMIEGFVAGVQKNPRVRILANPITNIKMLFSSNYSRTARLGELYESLLYRHIKDGEENDKRYLSGLFIHPVDTDGDFHPRRDNWSRHAKVPELVLNATTLNSGHNWQFTASWMGESPNAINREVDSNKRYRRMYYDSDAPQKYKKIRLGDAVGASSCVPGLFEPLVFPDLYPETTIRLVDGGVYDNQGVASLLEQDCNVILVSDATGQMGTEDDPGGGMLKPLLRSNSVMMNRVRETQYQDLKARQRGSLLRAMMYVHMKQGLDAENVEWRHNGAKEQSALSQLSKFTPYQIRKDIQQQLADMRTDLDSFSDMEAYALMDSGYRATEMKVHYLEGFPMSQEQAPKWKFLNVERGMTQENETSLAYRKMKRHLEVSKRTFFKIFQLSTPLNVTTKLVAVLLFAGFVYAWRVCPECQPLKPLFSALSENLTLAHIMNTLGVIVLSYLLVALLGRSATGYVKRIVKWRETLYRIGIGLGVGIFGWIGAQIHLWIFDRWFLRKGRIKKAPKEAL